MTKPLKTQGPYGGSPLQVPANHAAPAIECPHCGTVVSWTDMAIRQDSLAKRRRIWLAIVAVFLLSLLILGCLWRRFIFSGLDLVAEGTGSRTSALIAVAFALLALLWVLVWMLFPIFAFLGLRNLSRRMQELDRTAFLCAGHLGQLAAGREVSATRPASDPQAPAVESSATSAEIHQQKAP